MKHGDFTKLAKDYINRPGYSKLVLKAIAGYCSYEQKKDFSIADIGAGTGKLTLDLLESEFGKVVAVEPNDEMRKEGMEYTKNYSVEWKKGSGESTGLNNEAFDWVLMGSSFHWTEPQKSLPEFSRILKKGGCLTVLWNPRNLEKSEFHTKIEKQIHDIAPNIKRVSSGSSKYTEDIENTLVSTGHFKDIIFMETSYDIPMSKERYLGAWKSVNDIRVQAGEEKWFEILKIIEKEVSDLNEILVPYKTRAWTVTKL